MPSAPIARVQLKGSDRKKWEQGVLKDGRLEKSTDVFLMTVLLTYCQGKAICWPATKTLADQMRLGKRAVQASIKRLEAAGVIGFVKDTSIRQGRRFVILSHPEAESLMCVETDAAKVEKRPAPAQNRRAKIGMKQEDSSDSSLRSESSSSKPACAEPTTKENSEIPEAVVHQVKQTLAPNDAMEVLREFRIIVRKARGQWDLVLKATQYVQRRRESVREVVPYILTLLDSWREGIPSHVARILAPRPAASAPVVTRASDEKRAWYEAKYAEQRARAQSERIAV